jgi:hypothetical protein
VDAYDARMKKKVVAILCLLLGSSIAAVDLVSGDRVIIGN